MTSEDLMLTLVWLGAFTMVVLTVYFIMKFRAVTPPRAFDEPLVPKRKYNWQKPGIVVIGIGVGLLISGFMNNYDLYDNQAINIGITAICAGIAMVVANILDKDKSSDI